MKRLLEWKQRMLQSPLTRKSSRNASRTQTPTNSSSPVPSLTHDNFRHKILQELEQSGDSGQNANLTSSSGVQTQTDVQQVTRKGSGASRFGFLIFFFILALMKIKFDFIGLF